MRESNFAVQALHRARLGLLYLCVRLDEHELLLFSHSLGMVCTLETSVGLIANKKVQQGNFNYTLVSNGKQF